MGTISDRMDDARALKKLAEVPFLHMFADDETVIRKVVSICRHRFFSRDSVIIREGDTGDELFIILSGKVDIIKYTLQKEEYVVTSLDANHKSISVGELGLIDNDRRSATVLARTDCDCMVISRKDFIEFGDSNPLIGLKITREIARQLSSNLRKSNTDVITLFSALVEEIADIG